MVILKHEWFEGKKGSYLEKYDITWQAIVYFAVMFIFPFLLLIIFPVWAIVVFFPQNANINIIALAWIIFSSTEILDIGFTWDANRNLVPPRWLADKIDAGLADPSFIEEKGIIELIVWRNAGWGAALILLTGVSISIIYNLNSWNFYLCIFSTAIFVGFMLIAVTKYKFEKKNQNDR